MERTDGYRAPAEYVTIVLLGTLCALGAWAPLIVGFVAQLPQVFFDTTLGLPMAFASSVTGALTGHIARTLPCVSQ